MRTAVVRIDVDPAGELTAAQLARGLSAVRERAATIRAEVLDADLADRPPHRREVQLLAATDDPDATVAAAIELCAAAFDTAPVAGVTTFVSRGTDDDVRGVLDGFGLTGEITREPGSDGVDVVSVTLPEPGLRRVGESRLRTALEASLNSDVRIHAR